MSGKIHALANLNPGERDPSTQRTPDVDVVAYRRISTTTRNWILVIQPIASLFTNWVIIPRHVDTEG
jgi:hypothetical protein